MTLPINTKIRLIIALACMNYCVACETPRPKPFVQAGEMAGTLAGEMAGTLAGNLAGSTAGDIAGENAGEMADLKKKSEQYHQRARDADAARKVQEGLQGR